MSFQTLKTFVCLLKDSINEIEISPLKIHSTKNVMISLDYIYTFNSIFFYLVAINFSQCHYCKSVKCCPNYCSKLHERSESCCHLMNVTF